MTFRPSNELEAKLASIRRVVQQSGFCRGYNDSKFPSCRLVRAVLPHARIKFNSRVLPFDFFIIGKPTFVLLDQNKTLFCNLQSAEALLSKLEDNIWYWTTWRARKALSWSNFKFCAFARVYCHVQSTRFEATSLSSHFNNCAGSFKKSTWRVGNNKGCSQSNSSLSEFTFRWKRVTEAWIFAFGCTILNRAISLSPFIILLQSTAWFDINRGACYIVSARYKNLTSFSLVKSSRSSMYQTIYVEGTT